MKLAVVLSLSKRPGSHGESHHPHDLFVHVLLLLFVPVCLLTADTYTKQQIITIFKICTVMIQPHQLWHFRHIYKQGIIKKEYSPAVNSVAAK